jgi:hypothetical protein
LLKQLVNRKLLASNLRIPHENTNLITYKKVFTSNSKVIILSVKAQRERGLSLSSIILNKDLYRMLSDGTYIKPGERFGQDINKRKFSFRKVMNCRREKESPRRFTP